MSVSGFVRRITPPILLELFDGNFMTEGSRYFWDGIYDHYRDVPTHGERFDGDEWINKTRINTERLLASSREHGSIPQEAVGEHALLPLLASAVCESSGRVSILDFGGGMGVTYIHLISSLPNCAVSYHVVEREGIARGGAELFADDARIHFSSELPAQSDFDIVYISSALQYIEDYAALLRALMAYRAKYFLFVKLSSGDFPTYATAQKNVSGSVLPYWFINFGEIIELMASGGYALIYKSVLEQQYDQSNFPAAYRLGRACNLLFSRN